MIRIAVSVWFIAILVACQTGDAPSLADAGAPDGVLSDQPTDSDPNFCVRSSDCFVVADDCCNSDCDGVGRVPVGQQGRLAYAQSCLERGCQGCRIGPEWVPFCIDNRCTIVELGTSSLSACQSHTECVLRWGTGCCELCSPDPTVDLVSVSRFAPLCSTADPCDACQHPPYPEGATSICVASHCKVKR